MNHYMEKVYNVGIYIDLIFRQNVPVCQKVPSYLPGLWLHLISGEIPVKK